MNATQIDKNKNNSNPISLGKTQYNPNTKKYKIKNKRTNSKLNSNGLTVVGGRVDSGSSPQISISTLQTLTLSQLYRSVSSVHFFPLLKYRENDMGLGKNGTKL